jgi:hypothetical protein
MKKIAAAEISNSEQIKLALERLDEVATGYEKKWGVDRLIRLVDQGLAERFQEQLDLLNSALERHAVLDVIAHADALARGWAALDAVAESQGSPQIDAAAWEVIHTRRKEDRVCERCTGLQSTQARRLGNLVGGGGGPHHRQVS